MSPRKNNVITIEAWPDPKKGKLYKGVVRKAAKKAEFVHVAIENLDPTQLGRIHETHLPLPVRPSKYHKTCSFLMACGIDTKIDGGSIDLNDIAGTTVGMRFGAFAEDNSQQIDFERVENQSPAQANTPGNDSVDEQLDHSAFQNEEGEREF